MAALRVPFAVGSGGLLSLALFWLLWSLVSQPLDFGDIVKPTPIEFTPKVEAATTDSKPRAQVWRGRVKAGGLIDDLTQVSAVEGAIGGFTEV